MRVYLFTLFSDISISMHLTQKMDNEENKTNTSRRTKKNKEMTSDDMLDKQVFG